ncbi:hypothetical protein [Nocardia farcinica]|uniref:hypothetical protein n=1 Tax=Nocardia farcinica TaxID=37329 RepID=UPI0018961D63|nr:hypothetical protein [Nocardia farcinica]MBF6070141.1 hypothetical protein [Nocardia farcinica]
MDLTDLTGAELSRAGIAVEEAAHAIGGVLLGGRVTECWARADAGRVTFEGLDSAHDASVAWWGVYARARFEHGGEPSFDALREALAAASPEDAAALGGRMAQGVHGDVRHAEPAVRRLASRLFRTGSARNLDVQVALGVRAGVDMDTVRWAHRQRIDPFTITPAGQWRAA